MESVTRIKKRPRIGAFSTAVNRLDKITEAFGRFFETKTKEELLDAAIQWGIMMAPVNTVADVYEDPQLQARKIWKEVSADGSDAVLRIPNAPVKMSLTPWKAGDRASRVGEHNRQLYGDELGFSDEEITMLLDAKVI